MCFKPTYRFKNAVLLRVDLHINFVANALKSRKNSQKTNMQIYMFVKGIENLIYVCLQNMLGFTYVFLSIFTFQHMSVKTYIDKYIRILNTYVEKSKCVFNICRVEAFLKN